MSDSQSRTEKKSERMEVRLGHAEKQAFVDACDLQGDTPSGAVRRFIAGYTRRSDGDVMGEANRRLWRRYGLGGAGVAVLLAGGLGLAASGVLGGGETSRFLTDAEFAALDTDGSGTLQDAELGANGEAVRRVLDLDGSGAVEPPEAVRAARMSYQVVDRIDMGALDEQTGSVQFRLYPEDAPQWLVEFDLSRSPVAATVFQRVSDGAHSPERSVVYLKDTARPRFVMGNADVAVP